MPVLKALDAQALHRRCDPSLLPFQTTAELTQTTDVVGQSRAVEAVRFGIDIQRPGYNLFVLGEPGTGRHCVVRRLLEAKAAQGTTPSDWCYVNNFAEANQPLLLQVPAGRGRQLKQDMQQFATELAKAITAAFESDEYRERVEALHGAFKEKEENALRELGQASAEQGIGLLRTPNGFGFAPLKDNEAMAPPEFEQLPDEERERIGKLIEAFGERLKQLMLQFPRWRRELQAQIKQASRDTLELAVGHLVEELKERYGDLEEVLRFLDEVRRDVIEVGEQLRDQPKGEAEPGNIVLAVNCHWPAIKSTC
jgi:hypothetical protein